MAGDTTPKKKEPTAQEAMFFFAIVKHTRNKADIDWNAVACEQGFKNAEVAKVRFGQVKRKLGISTDSPTPTGSASRAQPAKTKSAAGGGTPTKVGKTSGRAGTKGRAKTPKKEENADDDDDDETVAGFKKEEESEEESDNSLAAEVAMFLNENGGDPF